MRATQDCVTAFPPVKGAEKQFEVLLIPKRVDAVTSLHKNSKFDALSDKTRTCLKTWDAGERMGEERKSSMPSSTLSNFRISSVHKPKLAGSDHAKIKLTFTSIAAAEDVHALFHLCI